MNSIMKNLFVLTLLLFGLSSCKKITHADTEIRGQVINQTDNSPLVGYQLDWVEPALFEKTP